VGIRNRQTQNTKSTPKKKKLQAYTQPYFAEHGKQSSLSTIIFIDPLQFSQTYQTLIVNSLQIMKKKIQTTKSNNFIGHYNITTDNQFFKNSNHQIQQFHWP
jgi:hypothetical protein